VIPPVAPDIKPTRVELLPDRVIKHFTDPVVYQRELDVYCSGLDCLPRMLDQQAPLSITIERVSGIPYLDVKQGFDPSLLAVSVSALHSIKCSGTRVLCHIDNQPKNILASANRYWLIDFSDSAMDHPESDLTHLMLFWADIFSPQEMVTLCNAFLHHYHGRIELDAQRWKACLMDSILRFDERRRKHRKDSASRIKPWQTANRLYLASLADTL